MTVQLFCGDCLEVMPLLNAGSIDAILTDLPYGTTACSWDTVIPFPDLWRVVKHVLKPRGVFVTTASQPFTSVLIMSNFEWFKYEWIWNKVAISNPLSANKRPMRCHENVCIFSSNGHTYNPQMWRGEKYQRGGKRHIVSESVGNTTMIRKDDVDDLKYPKSLLTFSSADRTDLVHPTQKPVALYEYLVLTYTNPGDTVLDMCAGSGTTGVACIKTGRNFIGIEKREDYFAIMEKRIKEVQAQLTLPV